DARVLDFGCGARPYERWFADAGSHYRGADIDGAHEVAIKPDGSLASADGEYDLVASFQVLEHVWDLGAYLGEARRALRPQGWLLLSTRAVAAVNAGTYIAVFRRAERCWSAASSLSACCARWCTTPS